MVDVLDTVQLERIDDQVKPVCKLSLSVISINLHCSFCHCHSSIAGWPASLFWSAFASFFHARRT
jgi:hypothetical protein